MSVSSTVSASVQPVDNPATTPAAAATPSAAAPASQPDASSLQAKIDELNALVAEKDQAIAFWHGKAKGAEPAKPAASTEEPEPDVLETITSKGAKGLDEILAKRGYVRADDVEKRVDAKAQAIAKEQELYQKYPDLKKKDSDFFKQTALHYGNLVKSGTSQAVAMEIAAERTELQFMREGKIKTPDQQKQDRETERRARIAAQAGENGGRTPTASEEDDELTDEQKYIARAMGISEDAYKARAKKGVAMKGIR